MSITVKIENILSKRRQQAKGVEDTIKNWKAFKAELGKIEQKKDELKVKFSDYYPPNSELESINFSSFTKQIDKELDKLDSLQKRLSRRTLNIGVIGRMRQGKSRLLQSLTGLDDNEIPTSDGGVCTKVLSRICHVNSSDKSKFLVHFHSIESLRENIYEYYSYLNIPVDQMIFPDDFESNKGFPGLHPDKKDNISARNQYGELRRIYYEKYPEYKSRLGSRSIPIEKQEIKKYITKIDSEYIAVKELEISCKFPFEEVENIGVIDLPGLGESIIDTKVLIKTLKEDIDFVLFVRKPNPDGDEWDEYDIDVYQTTRDALAGFPIEQCSFMILNHNNEQKDNLKNCQYFEKNIDLKEINVSRTVIANCSKHNEVKESILIPVLDNLLNQNINLSKIYLESQNQNLKELYEQIRKYSEKAQKALEGYSNQKQLEFHQWFEERFWQELNSKFNEENDKLNKKRKESDESFDKKVQEIIESLKDSDKDKSKEVIKRFYHSHNSYKIAYYLSIKELETDLIKKFSLLEEALRESEKELQITVINLLSKTGNLQKLSHQEGIEFFEEIEKQLPLSASDIKKALEQIKTPKTASTYENEIIKWIQIPLNKLHPDEHLDPISSEQVNNKQVDKDSSDNTQSGSTDISNLSEEKEEASILDKIHEEIEKLRSEIIEDCKKELEKRLSYPNEEAYTKFHTFFTRAFQGSSCQRQWRSFCEMTEIQKKLWEGAKKNEENQKIENDWKRTVAEAMSKFDKNILLLPEN